MSAKPTKSFKIPSSIEAKMHNKLVSDGYGLRGKSKWICDAVLNFLSNEDEFILDCVEYADELEHLDKSVSFRPTMKVNDLLSEWVIKSRKSMPELEGVKSKIIRASIFQALLIPSMKNAPGGRSVTD